MKYKFSSHLMVQQKKNYSQEIFNKRKCYIRQIYPSSFLNILKSYKDCYMHKKAIDIY